MKVVHGLMMLMVVGPIVGCAQTTEPTASGSAEMQQAVAAFEARFADCTKIHGYDPDNPGNLGPNELAPTERDWANCAYDALRATLMVWTTQPRHYDAIIAEHRIMTDKVESGLMTRTERKQQMQVLRDDLREKEIARISEESGSGQINQNTMDLIRYSTFQATRF